MNIIIPIGGIGKRFIDEGYTTPKPLIKSLGKSILFWTIENLNISNTDTVYIVYKEEFDIYNFKDLITNKFRKQKFKFIPIKNDTRGASETVLFAIEKMTDIELSELTMVVDSDNFYNDDIITICKNENRNLIFFKKDYELNPIYSYIQVDNKNKVLDIKEKEKISDNACVGSYCFKSATILKDIITKSIKEEIKQKNEYYISSLYKKMIDENIDVWSREISGFNCLGTPHQLKTFSSNFNTNHETYRFCFDLDNTLVSYPEIEGDYSTVKPLRKTIDYCNFLHSLGHTIIIHTARRMKTHSGNVGKVQADIAKVTFDTLDKFGIKYDEVYFGKPFAHFYIDDLAVKPSDDLEKETGFYKIHPETRSHNKIEIFDNHIIKYSTQIEGEKYFYKNIPTPIVKFFPELIDSGDDYIKLGKIKGIPFSFLNVNNTLSTKILSLLFRNINEIHHSSTPDTNEVYSNYYSKVSDRLKNYDFSEFDNFQNIKVEILDFLQYYETKKLAQTGVIHGDPVFTNILIDTQDNIKMIDMRGKLGDRLTIYGDIFYDYAKIYQSIIGYDHVLINNTNPPSEENKLFFENYIINKFGKEKLKDIKMITKSLILSLIPIHNNENCINFYNLIKKI